MRPTHVARGISKSTTNQTINFLFLLLLLALNVLEYWQCYPYFPNSSSAHVGGVRTQQSGVEGLQESRFSSCCAAGHHASSSSSVFSSGLRSVGRSGRQKKTLLAIPSLSCECSFNRRMYVSSSHGRRPSFFTYRTKCSHIGDMMLSPCLRIETYDDSDGTHGPSDRKSCRPLSL